MKSQYKENLRLVLPIMKSIGQCQFDYISRTTRLIKVIRITFKGCVIINRPETIGSIKM